jgi:hypothetical protein
MGPTEARDNRCEGGYERAEMHQMNCENGEYDALRVAQVRGLGREEGVLENIMLSITEFVSACCGADNNWRDPLGLYWG